MSAHRRTRAAAAAAALGIVLVLGMARTGLAAEDLDCRPGAADQEQVRAVLDLGRDLGPDESSGGIACESLTRSGTGGGGPDAPATTPPTVPVESQDRRCSAFDSQADAQAALGRSAGDLHGPDDAADALDADDDGVACEQHFGTEGQQVAVHPEGGVSAGGARRP
jgi:hypothetical protein